MKKLLLLLLFTFALPLQVCGGLFDGTGSLSANDTPPPMDEAFSFSVDIQDQQTLLGRFVIANGNYIYRDKIKFELSGEHPIQLHGYTLPAGENKIDEIFGPTEVYHHNTDIVLPLSRIDLAQEITFTAHYQGCSETFNICYPPTKKQFTLQLAETTQSAPPSLASTKTEMELPFSEQDKIAHSLANDGIGKIILGFFGLGLLLAFTPCVFPMIPILSSIIVGEGEHITTRRAFILSLTYVLAMSITYTLAGVITGLLGENLQSLLQNPWVIGSFSALFVLLSLSMFGLYELQLPHGLQNRLHQMSHSQEGGKLLGVGIMGLLSGLIVGPCLAPPLAGALIFIGQHGDPVLGGTALFAMSMGMGLPLIVIGTSAGSLLPKAGGWMNSIKYIFGVLMLALAIWLLERIIPESVALLLWGSLLIITAIYLGALNTLNIESSGWEKLLKGSGLIVLIYGSLLIIGSASGSRSIWQPLHGLTMASASNSSISSHGITFTQINNLDELNQQLAQYDRMAMLDLYADWCIDCKTMELTTFQDPDVIKTMSNMTKLQVDLTDNTDAHKALLKEFGLFGPPTLLFFDANGNEYKQYRLVGAIDAEGLLQHLAKLPTSAL